MEGKLKILGTNKKSEEIIQVSLIFCPFGDFYCNVVKRKCPFLIRLYWGDCVLNMVIDVDNKCSQVVLLIDIECKCYFI